MSSLGSVRMHRKQRPEILAPAGDRDAMEAAVRAGADAVYFGVQGFNARARATNFHTDNLAETIAFLHTHGVKGYVTLNTLVFDSELPKVEEVIRACAAAGVDAVIVQDIGVAKLVAAIAPGMPLHASTQMTCTDASSVEFAREMGASRVILAREMSLEEIAKVRAETDVEVEVFVHGALCISYSGQCLTSEAIGGRSANRGACAQACRLPYELVVDGTPVATGERAYLLSPEDLEASALVPELVAMGVASLKIEGRLKGPEYVASTTRLYRQAVDASVGDRPGPSDTDRRAALQTFTRGSDVGFFKGVDHQRLVEGRACDHRGLPVGTFAGVVRHRGKTMARLRLGGALARGDGLLIEGGLASAGEVGGRVWSIERNGKDVESAHEGAEVLIWFGPDSALEKATRRSDSTVPTGRRVFKTSDPAEAKRILVEIAQVPRKLGLDVRIGGAFGEPFVLEGRTAKGDFARVTGDANVERARSAPLDESTLREKLGKLGETPFELGALSVDLPAESIVPVSALNRARRALTTALEEASQRTHATTSASYTQFLTAPVSELRRPAPPGGLFVLCRTLDQALAAADAGASGVYLDFLELTGTGDALRTLRERGVFVGVAPPRIRKPGEVKVDRYIDSLAPDAILVRGLGALRELATKYTDGAPRPLAIGDFSLNVTNHVAAWELLGRGLDAFTPSFDLDSAQLTSLLQGELGRHAEVVVHHPMALFHMEHCAIAALLSDGKDFKSCGRPCDTHKVSLRDRAGMDHPVEADVGCRNTVFHAKPQSAVQLLPPLASRGVQRFRVELVRETPADVARLVSAYRRAVDEPSRAHDVWAELRTDGGYGVVKGSLRIVS